MAVEQEETLAADESQETLAADGENANDDVAKDTDIQIDLDVPKTTYKFGDRVEVKVAVTNTGSATATDFVVKLRLSDYTEEMGSILEFVEGEDMNMDVGDDGTIQIHIDSLEAGKTVIFTVPFEAVESGDVNITAGAEGDNIATVDPGFVALTIDPNLDEDDESADANAKNDPKSAVAASSKLHQPVTQLFFWLWHYLFSYRFTEENRN